MQISDVQAGRIGEYLLAVYSMLTSQGALVPLPAGVPAPKAGGDATTATSLSRSRARARSRWVVPAPDFNRLTTHSPAREGREVELHFRAHPDRDDAFAPFRLATKDLGPRLLDLIAALPPDTKPLPGARLVLARR